MKKKKDRQQVSIAFDTDQLKKLQMLADREDVSMSHIVRREIKYLIERERIA